MLTEEKTELNLPPEIFAAGGRYYIMDRRTKPQDEPPTEDAPEEAAPEAPPISSPRSRSEQGSAAYVLLGLLGMAAGVAITLLYPLEGAVLPSEGGFLPHLTDRLLQCGGFLVAIYLLGYFAAGGVAVWLLPLIYGLGAGVSAVFSVLAGAPLLCALHAVYTVVMCFAASRSSEFSSLLLSIASGKGGSVITDGSTGSSYNAKFALYLMIISAAAIAEAGIMSLK